MKTRRQAAMMGGSILLRILTDICFYELRIMIFNSLPVKIIMNLGLCCKSLRLETTRPSLFRKILHRDFPSKQFTKKQLKRLKTMANFKSLYMKDIRILMERRNRYGYFTMRPIHGGPHKEVILDHNKIVMLGRNEQTGITSTTVDEKHMEVRANCMKKRILLKHLGANPGLVGWRMINQGQETILGPAPQCGHIEDVSLINGSYSYKVTFTTKGSARR